MTRPPHVMTAADPREEFYAEALVLLRSNRIPFLVGGTFAYSRYTGIERETKDLDIFVRRSDCLRTLTCFEKAGYRTQIPFPHWLAKVHRGDHLMDVIFASGNGIAEVDDQWFAHAAESEVLGMRLQLCPPEEMIWSKAFVQERERFDGADVLHLLREAGKALDWTRLLDRFGDYWAVLLGHVVMFHFVYPDRRDYIPRWVLDDLLKRLSAQRQESANPLCLGTLLSREQYLYDIQALGYADARLQPHGTMTQENIRIWTEAIEKDRH
jgi:hypothetical protein